MSSPSSYPQPPQRDSWFAPVSIDLLLKVLNVTVLHPFVCWILPLCFRAQAMDWHAPRMVASIAWAAFVTLCWMAGVVNQRIAHGLPREVDLSEEVIVVTGGASGLGMLVAEVYGMRGATVAVLDVNELENGEARGVTCYKCDVGDKAQVAKVAAQIEREVSLTEALTYLALTLLTLLFSSSSVHLPSLSTTQRSFWASHFWTSLSMRSRGASRQTYLVPFTV
jgi:hypothetical protein